MPVRRSEGGRGGRIGRSNMEHHRDADDIKDQARIIRRENDNIEVREGIIEHRGDGLPLKGDREFPQYGNSRVPAPKKKRRKTPFPPSMTEDQLTEYLDILKGSRTLFYYFRERYALLLLSFFTGQGMSISDIRRSRFGSLLRKPLVKEIIRETGGKDLSGEFLINRWHPDSQCYVLTLDSWGEDSGVWDSYYQTSRPGMNFVLQLNFSNMHRSRMEKMLKPDEDVLEVGLHPVAQSGKYNTLGWSRIDISDDLESALIEEIQNDWIRLADECMMMLKKPGKRSEREILGDYGINSGAEEFSLYYNRVLLPHIRQWDEAILAATIHFLVNDMGIRKIYYHTYESGNTLKGLEGHYPPRSLYTDLPKRFCFQRTGDIPGFIMKSLRYIEFRKKREIKTEMFLLEL